MASGYAQAKFESIPGNETNAPTLSTKEMYFPLQSMGVSVGADPLERDDELRNINDALPAVPAMFDPELSLTERAYPDSLGFLFKLLMGSPTTTAGNGVITDPDSTAIPAGAYRHVWTSNTAQSGTNPMTAQFQMKYDNPTGAAFYKAKGVACSSLEFNINEKEVAINASLPALYLARISDPTLTPAYEALTIDPFKRGKITIATWLANTGTTSNFSFRIENPVEKYRSFGIASYFPDVLDKGEAPLTLTGSIEKKNLDTDDYDAFLAHTGFSAKVKFGHDDIAAGSYNYAAWVEMSNAQYVSADVDELGNKRIHGAKFDFKASATSSATAAWTVTLVNTTSSYA